MNIAGETRADGAKSPLPYPLTAAKGHAWGVLAVSGRALKALIQSPGAGVIAPTSLC